MKLRCNGTAGSAVNTEFGEFVLDEASEIEVSPEQAESLLGNPFFSAAEESKKPTPKKAPEKAPEAGDDKKASEKAPEKANGKKAGAPASAAKPSATPDGDVK